MCDNEASRKRPRTESAHVDVNSALGNELALQTRLQALYDQLRAEMQQEVKRMVRVEVVEALRHATAAPQPTIHPSSDAHDWRNQYIS